MRKYAIPQSMTLEYLLTNHLGSTSVTTDSNGEKVSEMRYKPFGEVRYLCPLGYAWTNAQATPANYTLMKYTFCAAPLAGTGQYSYLDDPSTPASEGFGLMFYVSRWYDPSLGRFAQADTLVPGGAQGLDRFAYVNNNPIRFNDPSGHLSEDEVCQYFGYCDKKSAEEGLGKNLAKLLWGTKTTWGDTILLGKEKNGAGIYATLVLFANTENNTLTGRLWDIQKGGWVSLAQAKAYEYSAAYNEENAAWASSDAEGNQWCTDDACALWAGGEEPSTHTAEDLFISDEYVGYGLSNYYYLDGWAYASSIWGFGKGAVDIYVAVQSGAALWPLAVDGVFIIGGAIQGLGPKATYPIVSYIHPQNPPPWYIPQAGFTPLP